MRFYNEIDEGIKSGLKRFYIYGPLIKDEVFFNGQGEHAGLVGSLAFQLLRQDPKHVDKVLVFGNSKVKMIERTDRSISTTETTEVKKLIQFATGKEKRGHDPFENIQTNHASPEAVNDNSTDNINFLFSCLSALNDEAKEIGDSLSIIFDNFHWETKLFNKQQHEFDLLKQSLFFGNDTPFVIPPLCFYIINKIETVAEYAGNIDKTGADIFIGLPSAAEIELSLFDYFKSYNLDTLKSIAKIGRSAQKNLRSILNIVHDLHKNKVSDKDLKTSFSDRVNYHLDSVGWDDIHLEDTIKNEMIRYFEDLENDKKSNLLGLILHGPAGTGKTTIAKVLSNTQNRTLVTAQLSDLKGEYIGHSAPKMKKLFDNVRSASPSILFLDEIETLFSSRIGSTGDSFTNDLVTQFLSESDGVFSNNQGVVIVGATNHIDRVDNAVRSRLKPILIDLPSTTCRENILKNLLTNKWSCISNEMQNELIKRTNGCSGRDLKSILSVSLLSRVKQGESADKAAQYAVNDLKQNIGEILQQGPTGFKLKPYSENNPTWNNIIGYEDIKSVFNNEVKAILNPHLFDEINKEKQPHQILSADNGFLLYGPPGNGKTFISLCMSGEFKKDMIEVNIANVLSGSRDVISNLNEIFDKVLRYSTVAGGVVLFFDEFDALAGQFQFRDTFLKRIDQIRGLKAPIILVAATNSTEAELDSAIIRRGRFDQHILVENPPRSDYIKLFEYFIDLDKHTINDRSKESLLEKLDSEKDNCSIAFIKNKANLIAKHIFYNNIQNGHSSGYKFEITTETINTVFSHS